VTHRRSLALAILFVGAAGGAATCRAFPLETTDRAGNVALAVVGLQLFLACAALAGAVLSPAPLCARLGLTRSQLSWSRLLLLVGGTIALSHGLDGVLDWTGLHERSALAEFEAVFEGVRGRMLVVALLAIGVAPGIAEELLFRGLLQRGLEPRLGPGRAIVLSAALFGALHLEPIHAIVAGLLGLYLGAAAHLAASIRASIACHVANNLFGVATVAWLPGSASRGTGSTLVAFAIAALCLFAASRNAARASREGSRVAGSGGRRLGPEASGPHANGRPPDDAGTPGLQPRRGSDDP
jgi:membrane protease YdiL (CAAX protease family)